MAYSISSLPIPLSNPSISYRLMEKLTPVQQLTAIVSFGALALLAIALMEAYHGFQSMTAKQPDVKLAVDDDRVLDDQGLESKDKPEAVQSIPVPSQGYWEQKWEAVPSFIKLDSDFVSHAVERVKKSIDVIVILFSPSPKLLKQDEALDSDGQKHIEAALPQNNHPAEKANSKKSDENSEVKPNQTNLSQQQTEPLADRQKDPKSVTNPAPDKAEHHHEEREILIDPPISPVKKHSPEQMDEERTEDILEDHEQEVTESVDQHPSKHPIPGQYTLKSPAKVSKKIWEITQRLNKNQGREKADNQSENPVIEHQAKDPGSQPQSSQLVSLTRDRAKPPANRRPPTRR